MSLPPSVILTDIEGTTTPIAFVQEVLFPYARRHLAGFLARHSQHPCLEQVAKPRLATLQGWMDRDEKITALKTIQGLIWDQGYHDGDIVSDVYPDVAPNLRRWSRAGLRLYVYSSGSVAAQKLLFGHTGDGDLCPLFQGFFDTNVGPKRESESYHLICRGINAPPGEVLFLSDIGAELDAAAKAGLRTCQLVRQQDGTQAATGHRNAASFGEVAQQFDLPHA